jgi:hypothetical protein
MTQTHRPLRPLPRLLDLLRRQENPVGDGILNIDKKGHVDAPSPPPLDRSALPHLPERR